MLTSLPSWAFADLAPDMPIPESGDMLPSSPLQPTTLSYQTLYQRATLLTTHHALHTPEVSKVCVVFSLRQTAHPISRFIPILPKALSTTQSFTHLLLSENSAPKTLLCAQRALGMTSPSTKPGPMTLFTKTAAAKTPSSYSTVKTSVSLPRGAHYGTTSSPTKERLPKTEQHITRLAHQHIACPLSPSHQIHVAPHEIALQRRQEDGDHQQQHDAKSEAIEESLSSSLTSRRITADTTPWNEFPHLEPPRIGVFALYYILTKLGIISDASSHWETKENIQANHQDMETLHQARLEEMKKQLEKENSSKRWGISVKVFSWLTSFMSIVTGAVLMITGAAAVAGALLVAGGVVSLTNQILEVTGGWEKIAGALPGDNPEKKRSVVLWMQIGISVLCLILSLAGVLFGGWHYVKDAMSQFMGVFGGMIITAQGVSTIGQGISLYLQRESMAHNRDYLRRLTQLRYQREDLSEKMDAGMQRLQQLLKDLARALDFEAELFRSDQMIIRS